MRYAAEIYGCPSDVEVEARQRLFLRQSGKSQRPLRDPHQPVPRLEYGRWLCDCLCGSGAGITREGHAHCFECGRVMQVASWPTAEKRARVDEALKDEPDQHWKIDEPEPIKRDRGGLKEAPPRTTRKRAQR